jgi:hypothetical protein
MLRKTTTSPTSPASDSVPSSLKIVVVDPGKGRAQNEAFDVRQAWYRC